ncbi:hypothetical protein NLJ89_g5800 [Agrocybe chaxingu]|uniref:Uncharacterized protein n=1 Tax=Agrocybe chaxingu TaxID=84603 RepID=A0A9W8MTB0_9AGAR|nr:hypothetical protein NLJ89_g5800 [Agrocybe chaxingu]
MKLSIISTFVFLITLSTSVMGQAAFAEDVDDLMAREPDHDEAVYARESVEDQLVLRGLEEVRRRSEDHLQYTGANRTNCYKKCDKVWGPNGRK